jgi:quaternary ammonium compound-resistance protein SugE
VLIKLAEVLIFKQKISFLEIFFMLMIMTGILGLKFYGGSMK